MTQEEIEAMLAKLASGELDLGPAPEPPPAATQTTSQEESEQIMANMSSGEAAPAPAPAPAPAQAAAPTAQAPAGAPQMAQPMPGQMPYPVPGMEGVPYMGYPMYYPPYPYPYPPQPESQPEPKVINSTPLPMHPLDPAEKLGKEQAQNLDLIMEVPLQVTVEIGRARRKVQDILEFSKGSLVVLDKLAGDQVDLFVNGKCIARGDVVVIEDNFGVRITEIVQDPAVEILPKKK